jgi:heavy metal sensor kinase
MTLTTRVSAFFLVALALVLAGFSCTLYFLARGYLYSRVDDRLEAAMATLFAVAEIEDGRVEWEVHHRTLSLGAESGPEEVCWTVHNLQGQLVDRSPNLGSDDLWDSNRPVPPAGQSLGSAIERHRQPWQVLQRRVQAPASGRGPSSQQSSSTSRHAALVLTVATSLEAVDQTLRNLAWTLTGLSTGAWLAAALLGRWICRRALRPISGMATAARGMDVADRNARLPAPTTGDELEDLGRAFNELLDRLQEAFERQRRFTGDAAHQLRTPLAALLGQIEVALRQERPAQNYRQALTQAHAQANRLHQIVEMLLFLARADVEARSPHLEQVDLGAWLPAHLKNWSSHSRFGDISIQPVDHQPLTVRVHPALLGQLLDNLLENACKYSEAGTAIRITCDRTDGKVKLAVEDSGPGIAPEDLPHLFEPFYRSAEARRRGVAGVGLGLAVANRIAGALAGALRAENRTGGGSRFAMELPAN